MRSRPCIQILVLWFAAFAGASAFAGDVDDVQQRAFVPNELLIKLKPGATAADIKGAVGASERRAFAHIGVRQWRLGRGVSVEHALAVLQAPGFAKFIEYAEPNYLCFATDLPNDPRFSDLYGLNNVGQTGGTSDADIDAPEAWAVEATGAPAILVGVVDTGIDYTHADLQGQIWSNPNEVQNGIDDDGNGKIDDVRGWDFVNNDNDPMDDNGHGTHVSGTIAGVRNNAVGVAGVASAVRLIPLKFLNAGGIGATSDAIAAIVYANGLGARITSNSWGSGSRSKALQDAIAASSALFVAAAGNSGSTGKEYPAGYDDAKIISVAATDHNDALATFSNYGASWVDLAAPGVNILSTMRNQTYGYLSGTSMATPHVSGAAAFVMAKFPGESVAQIKARLLSSVDVRPSLQGKVLTNGRLNLARAVDVIPPDPGVDSTPPAAASNFVASPLSLGSVKLDWTASGDDGAIGTAAAYDIRYVANATVTESNWATAKQASGEPAPLASGTAQSFQIDNLEQQTPYSFGIKVLDEAGNASALVTASATTLATNWTIGNVVGVAGSYREIDFNAANDAGVGYDNGVEARYAFRSGNTWQNELVESTGATVEGTSFRFAPDGTPSMSYSNTGPLKFATRGAGGSWTKTSLEGRKVTVNAYTSLAFDAAGYPAISYRVQGTTLPLKFARKSAAGWKIEVVDPNGGARYSSLAFDPVSGQPIIAYSHDADGDNQIDTLSFARWNGTSWNITNVDTGVVGYGAFASLAFDSNGNPAITHGSGIVRYSYFDGTSWHSETVTNGRGASLAFDASGTAHIGIELNGQTLAAIGSPGAWTVEIVDATGGGTRVFTAVDKNDVPQVLYDAKPDGLDLAKKNP